MDTASTAPFHTLDPIRGDLIEAVLDAIDAPNSKRDLNHCVSFSVTSYAKRSANSALKVALISSSTIASSALNASDSNRSPRSISVNGASARSAICVSSSVVSSPPNLSWSYSPTYSRHNAGSSAATAAFMDSVP